MVISQDLARAGAAFAWTVEISPLTTGSDSFFFCDPDLTQVESKCREVRRLSPQGSLATKTELGDERSIALNVLTTQIVEQSSTLTNHHEQPAATVMVVLVLPKMFGEVGYALSE